MIVILLFVGMVIVACQNMDAIGYSPKLPIDKVEKVVYTSAIVK